MLDSKKAARIRELQKHDRNSAGRIMTNEFFAFTMDVTIGEAAASIRNNPGIDLTRRIFVLNHAGELQGYVPARNLIINPPLLDVLSKLYDANNKFKKKCFMTYVTFIRRYIFSHLYLFLVLKDRVK